MDSGTRKVVVVHVFRKWVLVNEPDVLIEVIVIVVW